MRLLAVVAAAAGSFPVLATPAFGAGLSARVAAKLETANAPVAQLQQVSERRSLGATYVQVRQEVGGIPVLGSWATLSTAGAAGDLLLDHTRGRLLRPAPAKVKRAHAIRLAKRAARVRTLAGPVRASLALLPRGSGARLVWRVVIPAARPVGDFDVLVDSRAASVLQVRNRIERATTKALVFDPNPVVEQGSRTGLSDDGNKESAALTPLYRSVTLANLDPSGCLAGASVTVVLGRNSTCPTNRDFSAVTRSSNCGCFDGAMAYFHIDRMQRYIQSLGFANIANRSIPVHIHASGDDNSFYRPSDGSLNFGDGGVNDAQDADVIDHEYGHAMQDSQAAGFGDTEEGGAIGEGWGDYWQAAQSANQGVADTFNVCFAEWDTSAVSNDTLPCLRRLDRGWTLPQARRQCVAEEIHCVGQAWSGLLWELRKAIGPGFDRLILQSHFSYSPISGFADASLALIFADAQLTGGLNHGTLLNALIGHGFITQEQLDDEPTGAHPLRVPGSASDRLSFSSDPRDVYALDLTAGRGVIVQLHAAFGAEFALTLYAPGTPKIVGGTIAKGPTDAGTAETLAFVPPSSGTYFLSVEASGGSATYSVQTLSDADGDARADASDNCPTVANATQVDWNRNGKGDACDRSSRTTLTKVTVRGHRLVVRGTLRPTAAGAATWTVEVRQRGKVRATGRGSAKTSVGGVSATVAVPRSVHGRVQVRAVLKDPRYDRATSRVVTVTVS